MNFKKIRPVRFVAAIVQLKIDYGYKMAEENKVDFLISAARSQFGSTICQAIGSFKKEQEEMTIERLAEDLHGEWRIPSVLDRWNKNNIHAKMLSRSSS